MKKLFIFIISSSLIYATLRYPVFGGVDWIHFPLYVINKALALSGFLLLLINSLISHKSRYFNAAYPVLFQRKDLLGITSLVLIIMHVLISLAILNPEYYEKFFGTNGKMNSTGELSIFFGVFGFVMMWMVNRYFSLSGELDPKRESRNQFKNLTNFAILGAFLHTLIMGFTSWITPREWYGYMPPVSLVATLGFIIWLYVILARKP